MNVNAHSGPGPPSSSSSQQQQQLQQPKPQSDRMLTGPSCRALKTAVSALFSVDDFYKIKIGSGFFSEVYKVCRRSIASIHFALYAGICFCIAGHTQNHWPSDGTEDESITIESTKYVA